MKKLSLIMFIILIFILNTSCTAYNNLNTKQISIFKKELKKTYKGMKKLEINYSASALRFNYTLQSINEDEMFDVFYKTKELILNKDFQTEFFNKYFNIYFKEYKDSDVKPYPNIFINFDINNDRKYEYQFETMYYKQPFNSGENNEIDGYKSWTYWDFKSESKPVPEPF